MSESHFLAFWLPPFGLPLISETCAAPLENTADHTFDTNVDTNDFKFVQPNLRTRDTNKYVLWAVIFFFFPQLSYLEFHTLVFFFFFFFFL